MNTLPTDILIFKIFSYLSLGELNILKGVDRKFNQLINCDKTWSHRYQLKYNESITDNCRYKYFDHIHRDFTKTFIIKKFHKNETYGTIRIRLTHAKLISLINNVVMMLKSLENFQETDFAIIYLMANTTHLCTITYDNKNIKIGKRYQDNYWKIIDSIELDWRRSIFTKTIFRTAMIISQNFSSNHNILNSTFLNIFDLN